MSEPTPDLTVPGTRGKGCERAPEQGWGAEKNARCFLEVSRKAGGRKQKASLSEPVSPSDLRSDDSSPFTV